MQLSIITFCCVRLPRRKIFTQYLIKLRFFTKLLTYHSCDLLRPQEFLYCLKLHIIVR
jgi:hypothetical protein